MAADVTPKQPFTQSWQVAYVVVDGPPWGVVLYNEYDVPVKLYSCRTMRQAQKLGRKIAHDQQAPLYDRLQERPPSPAPPGGGP